MPILMLVNICFVSIPFIFYPGSVGIALTITFWIMVCSKGINYAFGQPAKEQLFIPTSRESKYKAKSWTDVFGSRFSKGVASLFKGAQELLAVSALWLMGVSCVICLIWLPVAWYLGKTNKKAVDHDEIVC